MDGNFSVISNTTIYITIIAIIAIPIIWHLIEERSSKFNHTTNPQGSGITKYETEIYQSSNYRYIEFFVKKFGENAYTEEDLSNLHSLLRQKGSYIGLYALKNIISKEDKKQRYERFKTIMLQSKPAKIENLVDSYINFYAVDEPNNFDFLLKLSSELGMIHSEIRLLDLIKKRKELLRISNFEKSLFNDQSYIMLTDVDLMDGQEFEVFLERLFRKIGYSVTRTPYVRDQGADLIVEKLGERMVVQAKRSNQQVSNKAIQEAVAALKHYSASKAIVVTNNYFTKGAIDLARSNQVILIDKDKLNKLMNRS